MKSKSVERVKAKGSPRALVEHLVANGELSELEASWALKAWELGSASKAEDRFECYIAGLMAGMAMKTVKEEIKVRRN
jgi:hypothetical protein